MSVTTTKNANAASSAVGVLNIGTVAGVNSVDGVLTVTPGDGWVYTNGQWYLDGVSIANQTALSITVKTEHADKVLSFQPAGLPYRIYATKITAVVVAPVASSDYTVNGSAVNAVSL